MISELKVWAAEFTQLEQQKNKRNLKSEDSLRDLRNNIKKTNILVLEVPQKEEKDTEKLFENVTPKIFSSLGKETDIQIQKAQKTLNKINPKRPTPRYIIIKESKVKGENCKSYKKKKNKTKMKQKNNLLHTRKPL